MTKEEFKKLMKEYNYTDKFIDELWEGKGDRVLEEARLRRTCELMKPIMKSENLEG